MRAILGWDIGGVNTKVARVSNGNAHAVRTRPFELQRDPGALVSLLRVLALDLGASGDDGHAITMTAELSQMFRSKREGVGFVLDAVAAAFPSAAIGVFTTDSRFISIDEARRQPLVVAAANWAATARLVSRSVTDAVLIDIGTTSTDIIPIVGGMPVPEGATDPDRLAAGELVYTGAVRTPVEAIVSAVPFGDRCAGVSAEAFALAGDVHVWRGDLDPTDYSCPTPDGRPVTKEFAGERIARVICADRDMLDAQGISAIAGAVSDAQVKRISDAVQQVVARHPGIGTAVVTGLGAFIAERAARRAGLQVRHLSSAMGESASRCAPAAAVALLFEGAVRDDHFTAAPANSGDALAAGRAVDVVVKLGGALLEHPGCLDEMLTVVRDAARDRSLLIVPGGGPFADAVRRQHEQMNVSDDAAHWMAVLAMDQYAELIASRLSGARVVTDAQGIATARRAEQIPVLAASGWLRRVDPLPHSWDVTSDSIAAWVAGELGARQLVLVKAPHAGTISLVDAFFARALRPEVTATIVTADQPEALRRAVLAEA